MENQLFTPKSIAIIGAPREKGKLGFTILKNIVKLGYKGKIYPINPKARKILGLVCYKSIVDIKEDVDLVIIIVPAPIVPTVLKECGQKKVKFAVIISAGFKETGAKGSSLEKEVKTIAEENNIKIVGPNCLGILNPYISLNASFADNMPVKGNIGFVSQSGAIVTAVLDWARKNDIGFSKIVSFGNKAGLNESDFLNFLKEDKDTEIVVLYLENVEDGKKFIEAAKNISKKKPVIVLKSGRGEAGKKTAMSHTGSMCGDDKVFDAVFAETGLIRVESLSDLFDLLKLSSIISVLKRNQEKDEINLAIVTNAGGPGVMAVDALESQKNKDVFRLAKLSEKTLASLGRKLPASASVKNPVDVIGDAKSDRYENAIKLILNDDGVDCLLVILTPQTVTEKEKTAEIIADFKIVYPKKPIIASFIGGESLGDTEKIFKKKKIPNYACPERAIKALYQLLVYYKKCCSENGILLLKGNGFPVLTGERISFFPEFLQQKDHDKIAEILLSAKVNKFKVLNFHEIEKIRNIYEIPYAQAKISANEKETLKIAKEIGYPVVIKTANEDIVHKTDVGGVKKGINSNQDLKNAYRELVKNVNKVSLKTIHLVLVQKEFVGKEIIIGMKRDAIFGPVIMFGMGGIYVEVLKDTSLCVAPIDKRKAETMIEETNFFNLLKGVRGEESVNFESIISILQKISTMALEFRDIKEIDINPLMVNEKEAKVVDMRIIL